MDDLFKQYYDWIDWDMFEGLSEEEQEALEEKNRKKYGLNYILKPGAPLEAIKAWKEDARQTREAEAKGEILN
jgi:hypothetical protein